MKIKKPNAAKSARKRVAKPIIETPSTASPNPIPPASAPSRQVETADLPAAPETPSPLHGYLEQLRTGELASRMAAAAKLGEIGGPEAVRALQEALRDPTAELAREAAVALGKARVISAVEALAAVLENEDHYFHGMVRTAAAESLGKLNEPRAIKALILAVRDPLAEPSRAAIRALGQLASEQVVPVLEAVLSNRDNYFLPSVRVTAAEVLAIIPALGARECLRTVVDNPTEDPEVRQAAMLSLA